MAFLALLPQAFFQDLMAPLTQEVLQAQLVFQVLPVFLSRVGFLVQKELLLQGASLPRLVLLVLPAFLLQLVL